MSLEQPQSEFLQRNYLKVLNYLKVTELVTDGFFYDIVKYL